MPSVGSAGLIETKHQKILSNKHDLLNNNKCKLEKNIIDQDSHTTFITTHGIEPGMLFSERYSLRVSQLIQVPN